MAFAFSSTRNPIANAKRVATQEIDKAIAEIHDQKLAESIRIHQIRKRCKKLRGLIRLIRPALGEQYATDNAIIRDAASLLSRARTIDTMRITFDLVLQHFDHLLKRRSFTSIGARLDQQKNELVATQSAPESVYPKFEAALRQTREHVADWDFHDKGFEVFAGGLNKTYKQAQLSMKAASTYDSVEDFHEWRKHVKYHWYHCRLLSPSWTRRMKLRVKQLKSLADDLGNAHDLADLIHHLDESRDDFGKDEVVRLFQSAAEILERETYDACLEIGRELFQDDSSAFVDQCRKRWKQFRDKSTLARRQT